MDDTTKCISLMCQEPWLCHTQKNIFKMNMCHKSCNVVT